MSYVEENSSVLLFSHQHLVWMGPEFRFELVPLALLYIVLVDESTVLFEKSHQNNMFLGGFFQSSVLGALLIGTHSQATFSVLGTLFLWTHSHVPFGVGSRVLFWVLCPSGHIHRPLFGPQEMGGSPHPPQLCKRAQPERKEAANINNYNTFFLLFYHIKKRTRINYWQKQSWERRQSFGRKLVDKNNIARGNTVRVRGKKLLMFTLGGEKLSMLGIVNYLTYQNYALGTVIFTTFFEKEYRYSSCLEREY